MPQNKQSTRASRLHRLESESVDSLQFWANSKLGVLILKAEGVQKGGDLVPLFPLEIVSAQ